MSLHRARGLERNWGEERIAEGRRLGRAGDATSAAKGDVQVAFKLKKFKRIETPPRRIFVIIVPFPDAICNSTQLRPTMAVLEQYTEH